MPEPWEEYSTTETEAAPWQEYDPVAVAESERPVPEPASFFQKFAPPGPLQVKAAYQMLRGIKPRQISTPGEAAQLFYEQAMTPGITGTAPYIEKGLKYSLTPPGLALRLLPKQTEEDVRKAVAEGAAEYAVEPLTSPFSIATAGAAGLLKGIVGKAAGAGFAAMSAPAVGQSASDLLSAIKARNIPMMTKSAIGLLSSLGMTAAGTKAALPEGKVVPKPLVEVPELLKPTERPADAISKRETAPVPVDEASRGRGAMVEEVRKPETPADVQAQQAKAVEQPAPAEGKPALGDVAKALEPEGIKVRQLSVMGQKRWVVDYPTPPTPEGTTVGTMHVPEGTSIQGIKAEIAKRVPGFEEAKPEATKPTVPPELQEALKGIASQKKAGEVWLTHGEGGAESAGQGRSWWTIDPAKAISYGPNVWAVKVKASDLPKYSLAGKKGEFLLPDEVVKQAKELGTFKQPSYELEPAAAEPTKPTPEVPKPEPAKNYDVYAQSTTGGGEQVRVAVDENGNIVGGVGRIAYAGPESTHLYGLNLVGKNIKDLKGFKKQKYSIDDSELSKWKPEQVELEPAKAAEPMRVGPGAMTAGEIESRARTEGNRAAAGEKPPGNNPPVTTDGSLTPNIEVSRANRDMNILNNLNTAQWTLWMGRLGQAAKSAIERIFLGEFRMRESINRDVQTYIDATISSLPRQFRKKGGQEFFNLLNGQTLESITKKWQGKPGGDAIIAGAEKVKGRLEEIRTTIRDTKRDSFTGYLNSADKAFVEDLFKKNIDPNVDTSTMTKAQMSDALALNEFPDDWGIADGTYLPHLFFGNYKITFRMPGAEGAEFVTRAKTIGEAKARIYELTKTNPEYSKAKFIVEQDSVVPADMIRLGDRQFWNMVSRMKKALEMTTAEIRQAQQGIIGKRSSKQKWFGSTMQRLGFGGYETNYRRVMTAYLNGFHRWKELSSMQRDVQPMIDQVHKEGRFEAEKGLNDIIDFLWGKPARSTLQFDNFVRNIPGARDWIKPLALDRWSRNARTIISNLTLRTLRFATINRLQPLQGLYPLVGEKILLQGKKLQHTAEGRALLDEAGIRLDPGQYAEAGRLTKFGALMQRFSGEQSNQEWAFLSMYLHGTQQGMGKAQAIEYAKLRGQLMTQFTPLISDIPPALRGPGGQLLFQFKRFPIKQLELIGSMIKDKNAPGLARMLGVFAVMGGASFFARQFFLDKEKQLRFKRMVDKQVGKGAGDMVMYGLPGYVGADISGSLVLGDEPFGANIYEKAGRALAGPTLSIGVETARRIATAARKPVSTLDKAEAIMRSIPSLKPIAELIRLESGNVDVLSPDGETKYRRQISDAIIGLGAFRSSNEANKQLAVNAIIELKKETARLKNAYFVSKGGEAEKKAIKDFNHRWPEVAILPSELSSYVTYRRAQFGKTEEQKVAGKKYRRILAK